MKKKSVFPEWDGMGAYNAPNKSCISDCKIVFDDWLNDCLAQGRIRFLYSGSSKVSSLLIVLSNKDSIFSYFTPFSSVSIVDFEQVNVSWVVAWNGLKCHY